ncbi:hypothetical protein ACFSKL_14460 [Belliella marina]|uniref:HPt domain-containing protein n=1 Tax=Belliella marina TaxID=1644146 RepID=A0ABW4VMX0_9BACT
MHKIPPLNFDRIDEMAEGDLEFRTELIAAIHTSLIELKEVYLEGAEKNDGEIIHLIRHKVKPTLALFEINPLSQIINDGKNIIAEKGFGQEFMEHLDAFLDAWQEAFDFVTKKMNE